MKIPGPNVICSTSMMQRRTSISGPPTQFYCSLCCCLNTFTQPVEVGLVWCQWELGNKNWQLVMSLNDTPTQRAEVRWRHMRMIFVEEISIAAIIQCSYNQCSIIYHHLIKRKASPRKINTHSIANHSSKLLELILFLETKPSSFLSTNIFTG